MKKAAQADDLAAIAHSSQGRWDGTPYIKHPLAVADRAAEAMKEAGVGEIEQWVTRVVALLHDVVEDTSLPPVFIADVFGKDVVKSVMILTRPDTGDLGPEYAQVFYEAQLAGAGFREIVIKLADVWHNATTPAANPNRARAWALNSASKTLGVYRRWMESHSPSLTTEMLTAIERLYGEADEAVNALLAAAEARAK
jgi:(p)ppGpp synthase/HD superfamily hydrolase